MYTFSTRGDNLIWRPQTQFYNIMIIFLFFRKKKINEKKKKLDAVSALRNIY